MFAAAVSGDAVAREIVDRLADELGVMAAALIRRCGLGRLDPDVVLAGGVFRAEDPAFHRRLAAAVADAAPAARVVRLEAPPVLGSALLGLERFAGEAVAEGVARTAGGRPGRSRGRLRPTTDGHVPTSHRRYQGAGWDAVAISLVDTNMESVAIQRLNELLILVSGQGAAPGLLEARASSFEAVYNAHHRDVSRHVILVTRGRDDVEEIVAETFARAFAAWRSGHGPAGRPLPWLLVIARRIATDRWRRQRLIAWLPLPDSRRTHPGAWEGRRAPKPNPEARTRTPARPSSGSGSMR